MDLPTRERPRRKKKNQRNWAKKGLRREGEREQKISIFFICIRGRNLELEKEAIIIIVSNCI
jgi:hypothetical protein